jgi:hypothetical protein
MNAKTKLIEILHCQCWKEWDPSVTRSIPGSVCAELANAIIEAFPQIEKKPVTVYVKDIKRVVKWIPMVKNSEEFRTDYQLDINSYEFPTSEERQQWIDEHYVEVFK